MKRLALAKNSKKFMKQQADYLYNADLNQGKQEFNLTSFFGSVQQFLKLHWIKFVAATIVAIGLGYVKYKTDDRIYESRLSGETYAMGDSRMNEILNVLNQHIEYQNWSELSKLLQMPEEQVSKLQSIKGGTSYDVEKKIKGSSLVVDQRPGDFFFIDVTVKDTAILNELQEGLVNYMNNNPLNTVRMNAIREGQKLFLDDFDQHQRVTDSITNAINKQLQAGGRPGVEFNPGMSLEGFAKAHRERMDIYMHYKLATEIKVLTGFPKYNKPVSPRLAISLALFILPFNVLLLLVLLVLKPKK